jgi:hypothetical protein
MGRLGGLYDFSAILFHGICSPEDYFHCAPLGVNCLQRWLDSLAVLVVCFVGFRDGTEFWGIDVAEVVAFQEEQTTNCGRRFNRGVRGLGRRTAQEPLFNSLMEEHHYLGYEQPVGEHLKFLVWAEGRPIACLAWSSAPRHLGSRDRYIGWDAASRRSRIRFIAYNTRFLILPWVRVDHLASHLLGRMAARISDDWRQMYGHPIYFLETFIDPERFRGTCYRAANWVLMGRTTGRGKQSNSYVPNRSIKEVLGYPLTKRFRELMGGAA